MSGFNDHMLTDIGLHSDFLHRSPDDGDLLITQGSELAETDVAIVRAVTGGRGDYANAPAEIRQTLLGMSDGNGVRLQMAFDKETAWSAPDLRPNKVAARIFADLPQRPK